MQWNCPSATVQRYNSADNILSVNVYMLVTQKHCAADAGHTRWLLKKISALQLLQL
jgi:hypothetical protein